MYLYGASGHAKVVIDILRANNVEVTAIMDDNQALQELDGIPVVHDEIGLSPMIVSVGDCHVRKKIVGRLHCQFVTAIHPSAIVACSASIDVGTVVMHGVIIQADAIIGKHCVINTKASIDHECRISDFVHIAPGCTLSGDVEVGECTWVGVGSVVKQGIRIGSNCVIGAGSVVVNDIPNGVMAYGCPCKVVKQLNNNDMQKSLIIEGGR